VIFFFTKKRQQRRLNTKNNSFLFTMQKHVRTSAADEEVFRGTGFSVLA
jgi:hypothetical protein